MSVRYAVIFEQADRNWAAYVPDLPGCITTGRTLEETERNIREAIEGLLRTLREFGDRFRNRRALPEISKSSQQLSGSRFRQVQAAACGYFLGDVSRARVGTFR
jgi:predicted RNase H-like HicB family nuclease